MNRCIPIRPFVEHGFVVRIRRPADANLGSQPAPRHSRPILIFNECYKTNVKPKPGFGQEHDQARQFLLQRAKRTVCAH
jgi:hypothetical protein